MNEKDVYLLMVRGSDPDVVNHHVAADLYTIHGERQSRYCIPDVPGTCRNADVVTLDRDVYVVGAGLDDSAPGELMFKLCSKSLTWVQCSNLLVARKWHTASSLGRSIVAIGGLDTDTVEIYDVKRDFWKYSRPHPLGVLKYASSCEYRGDVIVCGGFLTVQGKTKPTAAVWKLHKSSVDEEWIEMPSLNQPGRGHSMAVLHDRLYVIGGDANTSIEILNMDINQFIISDLVLPFSKLQSNATVIEDSIVLGPGTPVINPGVDMWHWFEMSTNEPQDGRVLPVGGWADKTLVTIKEGMVTTKLLPLSRPYFYGSRSALIRMPPEQTETLAAYFHQMENLPSLLNTKESTIRLQTFDTLFKSHIPLNAKNEFRRYLSTVYRYACIGVDLQLCISIIDKLIAAYKETYSAAAALLLDKTRRNMILTTCASRYLKLIQHVTEKGGKVVVSQALSFFEEDKKSTLPFQVTFGKITNNYLTLLFFITQMVDTFSENSVLVSMHNIIRMVVNANTLKHCVQDIALSRYLIDNESVKKFFRDTGSHVEAITTYDTSSDSLEVPYCIEWHNRSAALQCNHHRSACCHSDMTYFQLCSSFAFQNLKHVVENHFIDTDVAYKQKLSASIEYIFKEINNILQMNGREIFMFTTIMVGSFGDNTKVGRFDEFDIQLQLDKLSRLVDKVTVAYTGEAEVLLKPNEELKCCMKNHTLYAAELGEMLNEKLRECLPHIMWAEVPLRVINTNHPWKFICIEQGPCYGMIINVDIVPIVAVSQAITYFDNTEFNCYQQSWIKNRQSMILEDPVSHLTKLHIQWGKPGGKHRFRCTIADSERDIMDALPMQIKDGFKLVKWLLEVDFWQRGAHHANANKLITSYMVKNALFWILEQEIVNKQQLKLVRDSGLKEASYVLNDEKQERSYDNIIEWAAKILKFLRQETLTRLTLPSYFIDNILLFNDMVHLQSVRDLIDKFDEFLNMKEEYQ